MVALAERARRDRPRAEEAVRRDRHRRDVRQGSVTMTDDAFRPRRSVLYMPSSNERALEKAKSIPCDGLILDLEDAVAPDAKAAAREAACAAAASGEYGRREVTIRVNGADTEWHRDDLKAACAAGPDAIVVPKVDSADAVLQARRGDGRPRRPGAHQAVGDGRDAVRDAARRGDRRGLGPPHRAGDGHQRPRQGAVRRARARPAAAADRALASPCSPPGPPARRSSTASTTT